MNTSTKRGVLAAAGTVSLIAGVLGAKAGSGRRRLPGALPTAGAIAPAATTPAGTPATGTPTTSAAAAAGAARSSSPTSAPASSGPASRTVAGPAVDVGYGTVQVQITMAGGQLIDVKTLQLPTDRSRSRSISSRAAPILRTEALAAHSANIDGVSGATYTSEGYAQSLQGALTTARG